MHIFTYWSFAGLVLRLIDMLGRFFSISAKEDNLCDFLCFPAVGYSELIIFPIKLHSNLVIPPFLVVKGSFQGMAGLLNFVLIQKLGLA